MYNHICGERLVLFHLKDVATLHILPALVYKTPGLLLYLRFPRIFLFVTLLTPVVFVLTILGGLIFYLQMAIQRLVSTRTNLSVLFRN